MLGEKRKPTQNLLYQLLISPCQRLAQILFSHLTTTRHVARFEPYITFRDGAHQNVVVCFNSVFHANFAPVNALQKTFREIVCEPQYRDVSIAKVGFSITEIKVSVKVDYIEIAPTALSQSNCSILQNSQGSILYFIISCIFISLLQPNLMRKDAGNYT